MRHLRPAAMLLCGALALAGCNQQVQDDAQDVLNMQNDAQAVPVNGTMETLGTSATGPNQLDNLPLRTADNRQVGTVSLREEDGGVVVTASLQGMPQGAYAMHIHAVGKCEGPKFESAGAHWNPDNKQHGRQNPQGWHAGDLENITVGPAGSGGVTNRVSLALREGMTPVIDQDGASLMIHAKADDYRTDPSGNSGDRIACAVIAPPGAAEATR